MITIILLPLLVFIGFAVYHKFRNQHFTILDTIKDAWQTYVIKNQYYLYWGVAVVILAVISFVFPYSIGRSLEKTSSFLLYGFLIVGGLGGFILLLKKLFTGSFYLDRDTSFGSASFTPAEILAGAGLIYIPESNGKYLYIGGGYFNSLEGHLLTVAGSRSGKGVSIIVPNLLLPNLDSFLVTDPKGELAFMTAKFQSQALGKKVIILDPWGEQKRLGAKHGIPASGFNPLDFIKANPEELSDGCGLVADMIVPNNPNAKEPFWDNSARAIIKVYLMHLITKYPEKEHNLYR
jgi:type IV secretion system protein VirD4